MERRQRLVVGDQVLLRQDLTPCCAGVTRLTTAAPFHVQILQPFLGAHLREVRLGVSLDSGALCERACVAVARCACVEDWVVADVPENTTERTVKSVKRVAVQIKFYKSVAHMYHYQASLMQYNT